MRKKQRRNEVNMDKLYIVIPAYNEEENIEDVIMDWHPVVVKTGSESRLLVIDDGSKDTTYSVMQKLTAKYPQLEIITKPNSGHGATILTGYKYAIEKGADYIFQTDSDGQTLPSEFPPFWERRTRYAMVIGHRRGREDGFSRIFVTKTLKLVLRVCFKVSITDANTPYRLMRADVLSRYLKHVPKDYNLSNVVISVIYAKKRLPVKYIPITFRPRQGGVNSINMKKIVKIGKQAVIDFKQIDKYLKDVECELKRTDRD